MIVQTGSMLSESKHNRIVAIFQQLTRDIQQLHILLL
jgi:hypothetical protein